MKKSWKTAALAACILVALAGGCENQTNPDDNQTLPIRFVAGDYRVQAAGYSETKKLNLSIAFSEHRILKVTLGEHGETASRSAVKQALENIPIRIEGKQGVDGIDAITNATYTGNGIIAAAADCIRQAEDAYTF